MFGLFKKKSELEKLQESYKEILGKAHLESQRDRTASDRLMVEAEQIAKKIDELKSKE